MGRDPLVNAFHRVAEPVVIDCEPTMIGGSRPSVEIRPRLRPEPTPLRCPTELRALRSSVLPVTRDTIGPGEPQSSLTSALRPYLLSQYATTMDGERLVTNSSVLTVWVFARPPGSAPVG